MAENALGICYEFGIGTSVDKNNAFKWYQNAVEDKAGACAEGNLARCYRKGIGVCVDVEKAEELEMLSYEHGFKPQNNEYENE